MLELTLFGICAFVVAVGEDIEELLVELLDVGEFDERVEGVEAEVAA